jgi:hypothetical protein
MLLTDPTDHSGRNAHGNGTVGDIPSHYGAFTDYCPVTDINIIGDYGADPDYGVIFHRAVMQDAAMPQLNVVADHGTVTVTGVDDDVLLDRGAAADDNRTVVAADTRSDTYKALLADGHVSNHVRRFGDEGTCADRWTFPFKFIEGHVSSLCHNKK